MLWTGLEAGRMARDETARGAHLRAPAGTVAVGHRGVEPQPGNHRVDVPAVRVGGDPPALAGFTPARERSGRHRRIEQPCARERVADRARAVVAPVLPASMSAAEAIRLALDDLVRR